MVKFRPRSTLINHCLLTSIAWINPHRLKSDLKWILKSNVSALQINALISSIELILTDFNDYHLGFFNQSVF